MNGNERSTGRDCDPDTAPDLAADGWPEKFAQAPVRRGRPPSAHPKVSTTTREHTITDENVRGAPDLVIVIEILSPSTADRDAGCKHDLYCRHGVLEYWIVDPIAKTVAVHRQRDGRLELAGAFDRRDSLGTALHEGLQLDLDDILAT